MRWLVVLLALSSFAHAAPPPTRAQFAAKLARVKPGMTADQVEALLGAPDDIKTERDPGGISAARTVEIWRYGARGHLAFATLGAVHLQADRTVQYVFGGRGKPLTAMPEPELRRLLELLAAVPSYDDTLEPLALVRAVNALHALGKDRALAVVDEFLRVSSWLDDPGREGVFLVMRALFDVPAAGMPPMMVGAPSPAPPQDPALAPRFPLVIVDDVPFKLVRGYMLAGHAEPPEDDVAAFRKVGVVRKRPLAPTPRALDAIDAWLAGPDARILGVDRAYVMDQALRLFGTVFVPADRGPDTWIPDPTRWAVHRAAVRALRATWNTAQQRFELPGGKTVPPPPPHGQRVWWDLGLPRTTRSRVTFERLDDRLVEVEVRIEGAAAGGAVRLVDPATGAVRGTVAFTGISGGGTVSGQRLALPRGQAIRPELGSTRGPVLTP